MKKIINWGIVGTGGIANKFARAMKNVYNSKIVAVVSRTMEKAEAFANNYAIEKVYDCYDDMANDSEIDAVYIATLHPFHCELSILFLNAKKAVLCEKPVAMNADEITEMIDCANKNKMFFMEAMWTRFLPTTKKIMEIVFENELGDIQFFNSSFCFYARYNQEHRLFNRELGGGALLDVGIYNVSYACMLLGTNPIQIYATSKFNENQTDSQTAIMLTYQTGTVASIMCATSFKSPNDAYIHCTNGYIEVKNFHAAKEFIVHSNDGSVQNYKLPTIGEGFEEEIIEANECIRKGQLQSNIMPHIDSINIMKIMDKIKTITNVNM